MCTIPSYVLPNSLYNCTTIYLQPPPTHTHTHTFLPLVPQPSHSIPLNPSTSQSPHFTTSTISHHNHHFPPVSKPIQNYCKIIQFYHFHYVIGVNMGQCRLEIYYSV